MTEKIINVKSSVKNEVAEWEKNGVEYVLFAVTPNITNIEVYEIPINEFAELDIFEITKVAKKDLYKVVSRGTKKTQKILANFPCVATFDRKTTVEKAKVEKVNNGEMIEMILTNKTAEEVKKNNKRGSNDGFFNGKCVQIKSSITTYNETTGKNNSTGRTTIVENEHCIFF